VTPAAAPLPHPDDIPAVSAEELVDGELEPGDVGPRRYPSTIGGLFYLLVLAVSAGGIGLVLAGSWRGGIRLVGGALLFAAAVRAVLSARNAGMLAVRHKAVDILLLVGLGSALLFLASSIPNQPG
jgi:hypothetical protein